jgi:hypothetical protein
MPGHLIHIGFPKAGSTALSAWFDAHPQLEYAPNAIGGYYDAFGIAARAAAARERAAWLVTSSESLSTPRVSDEPALGGAGEPRRRGVTLAESRRRVCETLKVLFGDATILVVTRGFRGEILSGYSQYVKSGGPLPLDALFDPSGRDHEGYLDYDGVVALYEGAFGAANVIALPYELLRDDPAAFVGVLEDRLGLEPGAAPVPRRNPSLTPAGLYWYRRLSRAVGAVARVLPRRAGERVFAAYVARAREDRFRRPIERWERLLPGERQLEITVPDSVLQAHRDHATALGERPLYARYAAEYLNEQPAPAPDTGAR